MIASLPMYDRPENQRANDRFYESFRDFFPGASPSVLTRSDDYWADWTSPNLLLSQSCSLPYRLRLHGRATIVGTPSYKIESVPGCYHSKIVVRASDKRKAPREFANARLAVNGRDSQSGWTAAQVFASRHGFRFSNFIETGAHVDSAYSIARGDADIAAIDALTWSMIEKWDNWASELKVLTRTEDTPATPYITARRDLAPELFGALEAAIAALPQEDRDRLGITGLLKVPVDAYLNVEEARTPYCLQQTVLSTAP